MHLQCVFHSKTCAHKAGHDLCGEFRQDFDEDVGKALAKKIDMHQLLDDGMGTKAACAHTDTALQCQQPGDLVIRKVLHFKGKNRPAAGNAGAIRIVNAGDSDTWAAL